MTGKRRALGRGLAALIADAAPAPHQAPPPPPPLMPTSLAGAAALAMPPTAPRGDGLHMAAIEDVHPARHQPRKTFDDERLEELAESIRVQGIIQPLIVRRRNGGGYELIAGERRWRAAQRAGLHEVPVVVREVAEERAFELALVENLQRADLNPIEEAEGYQRLMAEFGYTQETLAGRVGKDRSTVANALRLLKLPPAVRDMVIAGRLSMGHARGLLGLESDTAIERLARQTVARELSVRQVETLVRRERQRRQQRRTPPSRRPHRPPSPAARDLVQRLERALGTRVRLVEADETSGHIEIHYHSLDELDAVLAKIITNSPSGSPSGRDKFRPAGAARCARAAPSEPKIVAQGRISGAAGLRGGSHEREARHLGAVDDRPGGVFGAIADHPVAHHQHRRAARAQHPAHLHQPAPPPLLPGSARGARPGAPLTQLAARAASSMASPSQRKRTACCSA